MSDRYNVETEWVQELHSRLLAWYDEHGRDLPWRRTDDPYKIWVSEIMLQQTQVSRVQDYFARWIERFPTVKVLADAPLDDVLKVWEGLGYYARARNLHTAAQQVVDEYDGEVPRTVKELRELPGIGPYTAGAVASIAFDTPAAALDANLKRVFARLVGLEKPVNSSAGTRELWDIAEALLPEERAGDWNEALMDLGATVCVSGVPRCLLCPFMGVCRAQQEGRQQELPRRESKRPRPHREMVAGVIRDGAGRILITQRPTDKMLGGLWEFPGGRCENGTSFRECLSTTVRRELGLDIEIGEKLTIVEHGYTHFTVTLHAFVCRRTDGEPAPAESIADWRWVADDELEEFAWARKDRKIIEALHGAQGA